MSHLVKVQFHAHLINIQALANVMLKYDNAM